MVSLLLGRESGPKKKETCSDALQHCIDKGIGYDECSVYPIPSLWVTSNSATYYFAGYTLQRGAGEAAPESAWFPRNQIEQSLSSSNNAMSRHRDLGVLAAVNKLCLSPLRRIFLMVNELHQLGFERLRVAPGMSASGIYWRCSIVPASCVSQEHGAKVEHPRLSELEKMTKKEFWSYTYGSGQGQEPFGWKDAHFDTPKQLAHKFIARQPEIAYSGWGNDPIYASWYRRMLEQTQPHGVFISYADYGLPRDFLVEMVSGEVDVALLPGAASLEP